MKDLHFSTMIDAPRQKVWHTMLDDATYREWTSAFSPGSFYRGGLERGLEDPLPRPRPGDRERRWYGGADRGESSV